MSLKSKINQIPGVCLDGKRKIADLLVELAKSMGHELNIGIPKLGEVWLVNSGRIVLVASNLPNGNKGNAIHIEESELKTWKGKDMDDSQRGDSGYLGFQVREHDFMADYWLVKVADNLEDYYSNRVSRLAAIKEMSGYAQ